MRKRNCFETTLAGYSIRLDQLGVDRFSVTYGAQVRDELDYGNAAFRLGTSIMHALALEGKLDNRERGEKRASPSKE